MLLIFNIMYFLLFFDKILPQTNSKSIETSTPSPETTQNDFVCPGTGLYPEPTDCASYHQCVVKGSPSMGLVRCPEPYNFDTMEKECRSKATANCIHCTENGFFVDNASPYSYIQCENGVAERVRCSPAGTIFNLEAQTCESDPKGNFAVKGAYDKYPGVNTFGYDFHPIFSPYMESVNRKHEWSSTLTRFMPQIDQIKLGTKVRAGPVNAVAKGNTKIDNETAKAHSHTFIGDEPVDKDNVLVNDSMLDERGTRGGEYSSVHAMATASGTGKAGQEVVLLPEDAFEEDEDKETSHDASAAAGRGVVTDTDAGQPQDGDLVEPPEDDGSGSKTTEATDRVEVTTTMVKTTQMPVTTKKAEENTRNTTTKPTPKPTKKTKKKQRKSSRKTRDVEKDYEKKNDTKHHVTTKKPVKKTTHRATTIKPTTTSIQPPSSPDETSAPSNLEGLEPIEGQPTNAKEDNKQPGTTQSPPKNDQTTNSVNDVRREDNKIDEKKASTGSGRGVGGIVPFDDKKNDDDDRHGHDHGPNEKHTKDCSYSDSSLAIAGEKSVNDKSKPWSEVSSMAWRGKSVAFKRVKANETAVTITDHVESTENTENLAQSEENNPDPSAIEGGNDRQKSKTKNRSKNKQQSKQNKKKNRKNNNKSSSSSIVVDASNDSRGIAAVAATVNHDPLSFDWSGGSMTQSNDSGLFPWSHSFHSAQAGDTEAHNNFDWGTGKEPEGSVHDKVPVSYEKTFGSSKSNAYKSALTENKNDKTAFKAARTETHDGEHHFATEKKNGSSKAMKKVKAKKSEKTDTTHKGEDGVERVVSDGRAIHHENTNITEHDEHTNERRHHLHEKKLEHKNESTLNTGADGIIRFGNLEKKQGFEKLNASHTGDERNEEETIDRKMDAEKSIVSEKNGTSERRLESDKTVSVDASAKFKNISGIETHEGKSKSLTKELQSKLEKDGNDTKAFVVNNTYATNTMSLKNKTEYEEIALAHQKVRASEGNKAYVSINGTKKLDDYSTIIGSDTSSKTNKTGDTEVISSLQTSMIGHTDRQGEEERNADGSIRSKYMTKNDNEATQKELTVHRVDTDEGEPESETIITKTKIKASNDESEVRKVEDLARNISQVVQTSSGNNTNSTSGSVKHNILSEEGKAREAEARKYHKHPKPTEAAAEEEEKNDGDDQDGNDQSDGAGEDDNGDDSNHGNQSSAGNSGGNHNSGANYANAGNLNGHNSASATGIHQQVASAGSGNIVLVLNSGHGTGGQTSHGAGGTNSGGGGGGPTHVHINAQNNFGSGKIYNGGTHNEQHVHNTNINNGGGGCKECGSGGNSGGNQANLNGNYPPGPKQPPSRLQPTRPPAKVETEHSTSIEDDGDDNPPPKKPSKPNRGKNPPPTPPPNKKIKPRKTLAEKSKIYRQQEDHGAGAAGYAATGEAEGEPNAYAASYSQQENTKAGGTASAGNGEVKAMAVAKRRRSKPKA